MFSEKLVLGQLSINQYALLEYARMRVHDGLKLEGPNVSMPDFFKYRAAAAKDKVDGWSATPYTF